MRFGGGQEQRRPGRDADQGGEQCEGLDGSRGDMRVVSIMG